ncbi:cytochrome P450 [Rhodococcus sp. BS-15]|uniref:cytochrome P450 n=1 Tax=Rhodococcus sp. BS-15 TaxID=1304954 RepID=UPI000AEB1E54|nr:cytochrome P450 [Rhodococcus sp. BS-15]
MPEPTSLQISPADRAFWDCSFDNRLANFESLRKRESIEFHAEDSGPGFWSVVSYDDIVRIERDPETFSNAKGFTIMDMPAEILEFAASIVAMDNPRHRRLRNIVQSAFTMKAVTELQTNIALYADHIVDELPSTGQFEFVDLVSNRLPLYVICELLGIPESDRQVILRLADEVVGATDQTFSHSPGGSNALAEIYGYALDLGNRRLADPTDDLTSRLVHATVDGDRLTPSEFGSFVILLVTAGGDTARQAISWALHLLSENPGKRDVLLEDFDTHIGPAIEEIVRWSSPVPYMRRTATREVQIGGATIAEGDKVVLWYLSGNHDERVFSEPDTFDFTRSNVSAHIGFGARGPHHCLGANLARVEIGSMLRSLFTRYPDLRSVGRPELALSAFTSGITSLPAQLS